MKILALDPGGAVMGFAIGARTGAPVAGTISLRGFKDGERIFTFASAYSAVRALVQANSIETVVLEAPLHIGGKSAHTERMLMMLSGAIQAACANGGVKEIFMPAPSTWRAAVYGKGQGFPDDPKAKALEYCGLMKWAVPDHNAGEAACMCVYGHGQTRLV